MGDDENDGYDKNREVEEQRQASVQESSFRGAAGTVPNAHRTSLDAKWSHEIASIAVSPVVTTGCKLDSGSNRATHLPPRYGTPDFAAYKQVS